MDNEKLLGEFTLNQEMSHSEKLIPMIKELLDNLNLKPKDIDLYGVSIGPGSFTGLRIGVGSIKTLAHLFNKPIIGISTIKALAYSLPYNQIVVPMIDARRNRVYTGIYRWEAGNIKEVFKVDVLEIEEILNRLKSFESVVVNGDGSQLHKDIIKDTLKDKVEFATSGANIPRASSVCSLAKLEYAKGNVDNFFSLAPEYLRPSQAERSLGKSQK